ncbi:MAG: penicillin-binding protein [Oscillospiraceae bacterium]|nr:penicillin-binding protein [Oscillospiraceae bacterium]
MANSDKKKNTAAHVAADSKASAQPKKKRKKRKKAGPIRKTLTVIGTVLLSLILVCIITCSIIAATLTVYVMQFRESSTIDLDLNNLDLAYTTFIYGYDENSELVELASISKSADRIPVSIDKIPQHVRDAFVYTEDERFYEHDGVDWRRTFSAFVNEILNQALYGGKQGGSTITQQLVKNITGDDDVGWERKMREIFRASDLEKYYSKDDILCAYLNTIGFGGSTAGIQAASLKYFGKDVCELTIAQGACLAAIPQSPNTLNPWADAEANKERQEVVLGLMLKNGAISESEYEAALVEDLEIIDPDAVALEDDDIQNWYVDMVIRDVIYDLMDYYGVDYDDASDMLYDGGYTIYTPIDIEMQEEIEAKFKDYTTFSSEVLTDPPQSCFIVMDYTGNILAVAGGVGEKAGSNVWNRATMSTRQPGSSIKPLAGYSYGIETDMMTWSSLYQDMPIEIPDEDNPGQTRSWPTNYSSTGNMTYSGSYYFVFQALQRSLNTISARIVQEATPSKAFEFMQNKYQFTTLSAYDADLAPLSVGALTNGVYLREMVAAYQVFGNGGKYFSPTSYTYVLDPSGEVILQHTYTPIQSISEESAYVMNKLLQQVVEGPNGTGRAAQLESTTVVGKTGTSQNWVDQWFIACTPDYVSGVWYGYDDNRTVKTGTYYGTAQLWKNIFGDIAKAGTTESFPECDTIVEKYYCSNTGLIASGSCPTGGIGYYKSSNVPAVCTSCSYSSSTAEESDAESALNETDSIFTAYYSINS